MFYRNISRYINKLCGWLQRLVVIARFQCIIINNPNCDKRERKKGERLCSSQSSLVPSVKCQKRFAIMDSVTSDTLISWTQHLGKVKVLTDIKCHQLEMSMQ